MDINEFKTALKNGKVNFSYKKKDGTIREAEGTLCKQLLPAEKTPTVKFKCRNINWDIDANETMLANLPSKVTIELDEAYVNDELSTDELIEEALVNELSDKYGVCVFGFEYSRAEKRAPKKLSEGTIFYYDLGKNGFRSFNESQLIDWTNK